MFTRRQGLLAVHVRAEGRQEYVHPHGTARGDGRGREACGALDAEAGALASDSVGSLGSSAASEFLEAVASAAMLTVEFPGGLCEKLVDHAAMQSNPLQSCAAFLNRRMFLHVGSGLAVAGSLVPHLAVGASRASHRGKARSCIFVYLLGGPPHLDMWDLKPEAAAEIRGPFKPIATASPGLSICEHLPQLARLSNRYALVRSVSHNNHNHTPMIYYTLTGRHVERPELDNDVRPPQSSDAPHLGAILSAMLPPSRNSLPRYVAIPQLAIRSSLAGEFKRARTPLRGGGAGFLGSIFDPLCVDGNPGEADAVPALSRPAEIAADRHERRAYLLSLLESKRPAIVDSEAYGKLRGQAVTLTGAPKGSAEEFSLDCEPQAVKERYGLNRFGRAMLLARRLAQAGVVMTTIHFNEMTICDGWDTHSKNFVALENELLPMLDRGLSALIEDLGNRGILDETLIVVMGEFGRTPKINAQAGRDHWGSCQSVLLAGGGIQGGVVLGASDKIGAFPSDNPVDPVDIHATMYHCMGLDPTAVMNDRLGRPQPLSAGQPLTALL